MNPKIAKVTPIDDYKLELTFTNGEQSVYDYSRFVGFQRI